MATFGKVKINYPSSFSEMKMTGQKSTQAIESLCSKMSPQATFGKVKINYLSSFSKGGDGGGKNDDDAEKSNDDMDGAFGVATPPNESAAMDIDELNKVGMFFSQIDGADDEDEEENDKEFANQSPTKDHDKVDSDSSIDVEDEEEEKKKILKQFSKLSLEQLRVCNLRKIN